ncbi:hypothetical protein DX914_16645 [Lysobacter silvisoli]|uniref:Uncharacterized protein n=1 Tax=Lysobacter silvisoli TaxID=2293254 RepID=A0A371JYB0_9GAMM|nr:hypothetical protein DX914_16645 [Lysobacter silvisoli]
MLRWPFLLALGLLMLNDAVLKAAWHNAFTGKLSDFAGVFAFAWFWSVVIGRARLAIHVAVAVAFVWWKSPWSSAAIEVWNALPWFDVARVVDYGDLWALVVLPVSLHLLRRSSEPVAQGAAAWPALSVAAISLIAFTATSKAPLMVNVPKEAVVYLAPLAPDQLLLHSNPDGDRELADPERYPFVFRWHDCAVTAEFDLQSAGTTTQMTLRRFISIDCDVDQAELSDLFRSLQPALRSRLGARLLRPYAVPENCCSGASRF